MNVVKNGLCVVFLAYLAIQVAFAEEISPYVDASGAIKLPGDYTTWTFLGAFSIDDPEADGAKGFHNVYVQPGAVARYRETGGFPDGTVLVKELRGAKTESLTTGTSSWPNELEGWFVMVKDRTGRFPGNPLWGDGWGWAFFAADDPTGPTTTKDYKADCLGCHVPVTDTDYLHVRAYPLLRRN